MKLITNKAETIAQGQTLYTVEARIRDGAFHIYLYEPGRLKPAVYHSDQYEWALWPFLRKQDLYWDRGEDATPIATRLLISIEGFTGLFFPQYVPNCMDPDYEAWWDGYIVEL